MGGSLQRESYNDSLRLIVRVGTSSGQKTGSLPTMVSSAVPSTLEGHCMGSPNTDTCRVVDHTASLSRLLFLDLDDLLFDEHAMRTITIAVFICRAISRARRAVSGKASGAACMSAFASFDSSPLLIDSLPHPAAAVARRCCRTTTSNRRDAGRLRERFASRRRTASGLRPMPGCAHPVVRRLSASDFCAG